MIDPPVAAIDETQAAGVRRVGLDRYLVSPDPEIPSMAGHLDSYLKRIGVTPSGTADLATLQAIVHGHTRSIAFENLDSLTGRPVQLDDEGLARKLILGGRGGLCFEHNLVLRGALDTLGYDTVALPGRVVWGREDDVPVAPRTHMLLQVTIDGRPYLVDVGFGGQSITGVLELEAEVEQKTPHEPFRLLPVEAGGIMMQSLVAGEWMSLYWFELAPQRRSDLEMGNWHVTRHPDSMFRNGLSVARAADDRRLGLWNNSLAVHHLGGPTERHELSSVTEVMRALQDDFLLDLSDLPDLESQLQRILF